VRLCREASGRSVEHCAMLLGLRFDGNSHGEASACAYYLNELKMLESDMPGDYLAMLRVLAAICFPIDVEVWQSLR
jgi:hypothetical protein